MIGVDTNVLVRLIVADDARQHDLARRFFAERSESDPAFISVAVVSEFAWTLRCFYDYSKDQVADALVALTESPDLVVEQRKMVAEAANLSRQAKVDFPDALVAHLALHAKCMTTVTFDKNAAKRIPGMELLA